MQINKLHSAVLSLKLGLICLYYPFKATILSYFKKNTQEDCDKITKSFAKKMLKPLKINFIHNNWQVFNDLPKNRPIIIMSNHCSLYDIPIILHNIPNHIRVRMLAKKELINIPIFGKGMQHLGFPTIDRQNRKQAIIDLENTKKLMQNGTVIWASPEGTRSIDGRLLKFKKGIFVMAIQMDAIIIPVGIKGANKVLPARSYNYSLNETVELTAGKLIDTREYNLENKDKVINHIREEISKCMA